MHAPRPELTEMPSRIATLPIDERGYPVPWFVAWIAGKPEFRAMDPRKFVDAIRHERCWVCGEFLGKFKCFVIGPMCGINRTTSEPPSHYDCAQWSAKNCPFLTRPHMVRREDDLSRSCEANVAGFAIKRNPGVTLLWTTLSFRIYSDPDGKPLIEIGPPVHVEWWAEGRAATREEVVASIDSGLPFLAEKCEEERNEFQRREARAALERMHAAVVALYPKEVALQG